MRKRTSEINIRVFKTEKEKIRRNASKAGMNVSDYIRNVALNRVVKQAPTEEFMEIYKLVKEIHNEFRWEAGGGHLDQKFEKIEVALLDLYHGKEEEKDGSDENMVY